MKTKLLIAAILLILMLAAIAIRSRQPKISDEQRLRETYSVTNTDHGF